MARAFPVPNDLTFWWRHMIPDSSIARVGYNDDGVIITPDLALLDFVNDLRGMIVTANKTGISRMLVIRSNGLEECYGRERSGSDRTHHVALIQERCMARSAAPARA